MAAQATRQQCRAQSASSLPPPSRLLAISLLCNMLFNTLLLCFTLHFSLVVGQFGFFEQMFGGHQQQQHRPAGGMGQWQAHSDAGMSELCLRIVSIFSSPKT